MRRGAAMLTVKKILAGRGAVDYYLNQTRRGLTDYYLPENSADGIDGIDGVARLPAPGSSWWGGGAETLELSGEVERAQFAPLYAKAVRPGGGYLGRRFRLPEEAAAAKAGALLEAADIADRYERWLARHEIRRRGGHASVAAWDCTFSPPKSVSLLWAAGDRRVQQQVWAAHLAAVDAGLGYLEEHAAYVRAGAQGVRVLDTSGLVVARMNEWTSRDGDMHLHTHCLVLNRAQALTDGRWRALDGRALLSARTGAGALYNRALEAELTRRLGVAWRDRPDGLRELDGVDDELIEAFSSRRRAITATVEALAAAYRDKYGVDAPPAVLSAMAQTAWAKTRQRKRDVDPGEALERWEATARRHGR
ncbi:MAG TPA: MobF family relaxase, partial [Egibacteraceae bacterium]|nr:MobF family relaxase [Egibacteraceae bacterium]